MPCTEAYKEHIMYTFNGFCKTVIRFAALNAWRDRSRRRQKEISLEYLTEEKFYPLGTTDEYFEAPYEEHPITICGQTVILTNGELAAALLFLPEYDRVSNPQDFTAPAKENGGAFAWGIRIFCPMKRLSGRPAESRKPLATFKHISSKNADYGAAEQYLTFEHDEFTMKPTLDGNGRLVLRDDYRISSLNCGDEDFAIACMRSNLKYGKNQNLGNMIYTDSEIMNLLANGIEKKHYMEDGTFGYSEGVDALQEKQVVRTEI